VCGVCALRGLCVYVSLCCVRDIVGVCACMLKRLKSVYGVCIVWFMCVFVVCVCVCVHVCVCVCEWVGETCVVCRV
jgi:hypothetical protein